MKLGSIKVVVEEKDLDGRGRGGGSVGEGRGLREKEGGKKERKGKEMTPASLGREIGVQSGLIKLETVHVLAKATT